MKRLTLIDKAFLLKKNPMFCSLDLDLLLPIADKLVQAIYKPAEVIFSPGEEGHRLYFIVSGEIDILNLKGDAIAKLNVEDFFGEESLFNEKPRSYEAIAKTDAVLFTLSKTHLMTIISECPSVAINLLQVITTAVPQRHKKDEERT